MIFEIIKRSVNFLDLLSLKLKSLILESVRDYSWSTCGSKGIENSVTNGESPFSTLQTWTIKR